MTETCSPTVDVRAEFGWRSNLPVHPAAELFPLMSPDGLRVLGADIIKNGLTSPIALWRAGPGEQAALLDGRNRLDAIESATGCPVIIKRHVLASPSITAGDLVIVARVIELDHTVDPYAYVISANIHRRHLSVEQRQDLLIKLIARAPEKSDRQIAKEVGVDHKTIAKARAKGVDVGTVPHVSTRIDTKGRKQPAEKKSVKKAPAESGQPRKPPEKGGSLAEITRRIKLADELPKIKNTSLDTPTEKDALIELKQLDEACVTKLVRRAAQGEAVSATAEIDKREFKPQPDAAKLMEVFNRHLLRVWVRATPVERRQWLKNLEENADLDAPASLRREAA
jgi:hypothetical protein